MGTPDWFRQPTGIRTIFRTNLDGYEREQWPEFMPCPPAKGDYVRSASKKTLRVCSLTWAPSSRHGVILEVELHR